MTKLMALVHKSPMRACRPGSRRCSWPSA